MGVSSDSFAHDQHLEAACHEFMRWHVEGTTLDLIHQHGRLKELLAQIEASCRGMGREAVRFRSPHRRHATIWEIQVRDLLEDIGCPLRRAALGLTCAQIVSHTLDLPAETIARVSALAHGEIGAVFARFRNEAGRSGVPMDVMTATVGMA